MILYSYKIIYLPLFDIKLGFLGETSIHRHDTVPKVWGLTTDLPEL